MIPEKIGRYEIKAELGRGGMATVYRANDPRSEREVAVKVLPREMLHDPQFRTRFEREAKTIAMLEHPAIVPVYDFGEEDGQPYFVMRYMSGGSLSDRLKDGPMSVAEAAKLYLSLAPALDTAHAKGIIHRDLKPGNILFDSYGEPYISDFGIAKLTEAQAGMTGSAIIGTPAYMSPEQAQGEAVDGRSDIYGLGIILFEMLTGVQPFSGDTPMSVVVKQITDPVPHILDVKPDLPGGIPQVIEKSLAKDRNERFATAQQLAEALDAVAKGAPLDLGPAPTATRMAMPRTMVAEKKAGKTVLAKPGEAAAAPKKGRRGAGLWVGLGIGAVVVCVAVTALGLFLFKDQIPFLAGPAATETTSRPTFTLQGPQATDTRRDEPPAQATTEAPPPPTEEARTETPTPDLRALVVGGADMIAFLSGNNIWAMRPDGSDLVQLTTDGSIKHSLNWSPDGEQVIYISGKCIWTVGLEDRVTATPTCFNSSEYFEDLAISPDGSQMALALDRVLYVVPFDLAALQGSRNHTDLINMKGCFTYEQLGVKGVRFSQDGRQVAAKIIGTAGGIWVDLIRVFDISGCNSANPPIRDTFPASRFNMSGYDKTPIIPFFDWSGPNLFLLNSIIRNETYGYLYLYDMETLRAKLLDPVEPNCCYTDAAWSPDGSYMFFAYQDMSLGANSRNLLYYVPYGTIGSGATYDPLPLPENLLVNPRDHPAAALRPAK